MKTISLLFTVCTISLFSCNIQKNVSKINDEKELEHGNNYGLTSIDAQSLPYGATMFDCIYNFYNQNKTNSINTTNWIPLGPSNHPSGSLRGSGPGRVTFVYLDPYHTNRMFTGSATGGLFISNDMGQNWEQTINNNFGPVIGVSSIVTFPNQPNTWVVATGDGEGWGNEHADNPSWGIYRTTDGGITYQKIENFYDPILQNSVNLFQIKKLVLDDHNYPNYRLYAATSFGLFICDNPLSASPQWTNAYTGLDYEEIFDIEFKRTATGYDYQTIFASGTRVIMSNDYGITWSQIYNVPNTKRITIETTPANVDELFFAATISNTKIYKYNYLNGSTSFIGNSTPTLTVNRHQAFALSPINENFLFCGDVSLYYSKSTLPFTWTSLGSKLHDDIHGIAFTPDGSKVFIANDGGIHFIETSLLDGTSQPNFIPLNKGLNVANIQSFSTSPIDKNLITWASEHTGGNIMFNGNSRNLIVADGRKSIFCKNGTNFYTSGQENNIKFYNLDLTNPLNLYTQNNITIGPSNPTFDTYFTIGNSDPAVFYGNFKINGTSTSNTFANSPIISSFKTM